MLDRSCGAGPVDLAVGWRPEDNWLTMVQLFVDAPDDGSKSVKAQLSVVRFDASGRAVQLGVRARLVRARLVRARLDSDDLEPAVVLSFWSRPGA